MTFIGTIHDPLKINLHRQKSLLLSSISPNTIYFEALKNASSSSQLLATLSTLLAVPAFTQLIATLFRPILIYLCARWLENEDASEQHLVALCYLLEVHEELFPILHQLLLSYHLEGPLAFIDASPSPLSINVTRLHQLLLAYYRILQANRELPAQFHWSLKPLSQLIWTPHLDNGIRILAIRCYSLQSGMCEEERRKLETEVLGEACGVDCQLDYGQNIDGTPKMVDGWIMPVVELKRVQEERDAIITRPIDYFSQDNQQPSCIELSDLRYLFFPEGIMSIDLLF
ncbi:hypothetical protein BYT27DRAFT_6882915 [Phlegmacium glaucopus]|nr:hypothetical protein BYT27DRAFT_6882915 [Phlegmacium glaucopus]